MMITIGITTYNRLSILKKMAQSLYESNLIYPYNIRVYDDLSTEFSIDELSSMFPHATTIHRHRSNIGPDKNMYYMYKDFLLSDDQYFFNADADLIFSKKWMELSIELLKNTDGVLSIFNTKNHLSVAKKNSLCEKMDIGAAGTLFKREHIQKIVDHFKTRENDIHVFDWQWNKFLNENGVRLYSTEMSLVQHIGFDGNNSSKCNFDYGSGFIVDSLNNGQILNDLFEEYIMASTQDCKRKCKEYNWGAKILTPIRFIKHRILKKSF